MWPRDEVAELRDLQRRVVREELALWPKEDGSFDVSLVCYPSEDIAFRTPETCQIGPLQAEGDWDKSSLKVLAAKVTCENFEISQDCNLSQGVIFVEGLFCRFRVCLHPALWPEHLVPA
eukprot:s1782_g9.t1